MTDNEKMVLFEVWCGKCKHDSVKEEDDPCDECLRSPFNTNTNKPVKWEEKE